MNESLFYFSEKPSIPRQTNFVVISMISSKGIFLPSAIHCL